MSATFWIDWLVRVVAILSFLLYLKELRERKHQKERMLDFLHGAKALIVAMSQRATSTAADWQSLLDQFNYMLATLHAPKKKDRS
jgi:hypothetical protein